jgi:hypothetical protein
MRRGPGQRGLQQILARMPITGQHVRQLCQSANCAATWGWFMMSPMWLPTRW